MNQVGYDFAIPGNHEFDYGMPRFLELSGKLNCGYYSCNFTNLATGAPVFAPYKMMDYGDTQVAFVGVSTPESFTNLLQPISRMQMATTYMASVKTRADRLFIIRFR